MKKNKPKILSNDLNQVPKTGERYQNELNNPEVHDQIVEAFDKYDQREKEKQVSLDRESLPELGRKFLDTLELAAKITDEKGDREIKSLSGGQMVILKIVRMLSISSYIRSPMLFMDETINNLDIETVGKVADMLEDFVKQRSMKLYTITHSQQIQQMDIWDEIIQIENGSPEQ